MSNSINYKASCTNTFRWDINSANALNSLLWEFRFIEAETSFEWKRQNVEREIMPCQYKYPSEFCSHIGTKSENLTFLALETKNNSWRSLCLHVRDPSVTPNVHRVIVTCSPRLRWSKIAESTKSMYNNVFEIKLHVFMFAKKYNEVDRNFFQALLEYLDFIWFLKIFEYSLQGMSWHKLLLWF